MAVDQAQRQNFSSMFLPVVESVNPCLILIVRRENIVGDTMEVLRKSKNVDYKKPLKVSLFTLCHHTWVVFIRACYSNTQMSISYPEVVVPPPVFFRCLTQP